MRNVPFGSPSTIRVFWAITTTGPHRSTSWTNRSNNTYYQYGANGSISKLQGTHSVKAGADYRILGLRSFSYGASTGTYTFDGRFTGNALADMLLGYAGSGNIPISTPLDGSIRYAAGFVQDDWRVNGRLTLNYGLRLEHETNLEEKQNRITTDGRAIADVYRSMAGEAVEYADTPTATNPTTATSRRRSPRTWSRCSVSKTCRASTSSVTISVARRLWHWPTPHLTVPCHLPQSRRRSSD